MKQKLTKKEVLFCQLYSNLGQAREAAAFAGYENPKEDSALLLAQPSIQNYCQQLVQDTKASALKGLERLAFASCLDAVKLCREDHNLSAQQWESLDLFCVSQMKKNKDGSLEIVLYNRLEALKALMDYSPDTQNQTNLLNALAKTVESDCESDDEN